MKNKKFWENAFKNNLRSQRNFPNEELVGFLEEIISIKRMLKF